MLNIEEKIVEKWKTLYFFSFKSSVLEEISFICLVKAQRSLSILFFSRKSTQIQSGQ